MKKLLIFVFFCSVGFVSLRGQKKAYDSLDGKWIYVSSSQINLGKIPENLLPQLVFNDSSKTLSGFTGCNGINGSYATEGNQLTFGTMITTNKACDNMEVEKYIADFLKNVGSYKIESGKLYLYNTTDKGKYIVYKRNDII